MLSGARAVPRQSSPRVPVRRANAIPSEKKECGYALFSAFGVRLQVRALRRRGRADVAVPAGTSGRRPRRGGPAFVVSSGYRCPAHNKAVGGVADSAHTRGYAADIRCTDSHTRFAVLRALLEVGFRRIELAPTWIHVDCDPAKPRDVAFYPRERA